MGGSGEGGLFSVAGDVCALGMDEGACGGVGDEDFGGNGGVEAVWVALVNV